MKVESRLTYDKVKFEQENDLHLVVSLTAPTIDWQAKRPSICVIPVIDVSTSMNDNNKLEYAKQSALKLIDHLQPGDHFGLVSFSTDSYLISAPREVTQARKDEWRTSVNKLHTIGGTNLAAGMLEGLAQAAKTDLPEGVIVRLILFTDGEANEGVATKAPDLVRLLNQNIGKASLSAFGYGSGANQALLGELAKSGNGNYAFVKAPEDALTAFGKELGGLLSTYAQNIQIKVFPHAGHKLMEVVSDVDVDDAPTKGGKLAPEPAPVATIKMANILSEETRHVVMSVKLGKQTQAFPRESSIFDISVSYDLLDEAGKKKHVDEELKAKVRFVKDGEEQQKPTKEVDKIVALHQMVKKQVEAEQLADRGNYMQAAAVMSVMSMDAHSRGLDEIRASSAAIGARMGSSANYASSQGFLRSMAIGSSRGYGSSSYDPQAAVLMDSMGVSMSNHTHNATAASFAAGTSAPPVAVTGTSAQGPVMVTGGTGPGLVGVPNIAIQPPVAVTPEQLASLGIVPPAAVPAKKSAAKKASAKSSVKKNRSKRW
jgi:Ca-activated chloride channel homolog